MDHELLKELAHFKVLLRKAKQHSTDIERLISDPPYAKQVLSLAEEADSEELVLMALDLKDKLGLLPQPGVPKVEPVADAEEGQKYVKGLRG